MLGRIRVYGLLGPAVYHNVRLLISGEIQFPYRHWPIHKIFEDSSPDSHALPDDFTWQTHIYRNDLHGVSPSSNASKERAAPQRSPASSVVGEPTFPWSSKFVNHPHAALACVVSVRLRNSRMVSAISR